MSYRLDKYRVANAFMWGAVNGYKDFCRNIVHNYAQVYYTPVKDVLACISVMFIDPEGFEYEDYRKIKLMINELMKEAER